MDNGDVFGVGGGIALAVSAALWLIYLMPAWFRRQEFLATERNAVRMQQALRIMAETSDIPAEVRAELSSRSVAEQEAALRRAQKDADRAAKRQAAYERAEARAVERAETAGRARRLPPSPAMRLRRTRLATTSFVAVSLVVGVWAGVQFMLGGATAGWLAAFGGSGFLGGVLLLRRLSRSAAPTSAAPRRPQRPQVPLVDFHPGTAPVAVDRSWTPNPLPRPRYVDQPYPQVAGEEARRAAAARLREAALASAVALREAQQALPAVQPRDPQPEREQPRPAASASPWARMGRVDAVESGLEDLDSVLRRRRATG